MRSKTIALSVIVLLAIASAAAAYTEPVMNDYTAYPIQTSASVPPNIMIILDNSGSMNFNAYGSEVGDNQTVPDSPFMGEPYNKGQSLNLQVFDNNDDAEENVSIGAAAYNDDNDLDIGERYVVVRFQDVAIPQGSTINAAVITFTSMDDRTDATSVTIDAEASDDSSPVQYVADNIKDRTYTTATVAWDSLPAWTTGNTYDTPDLKTIVQEITDRKGWTSGSSIMFRFSTGGSRGVHPSNGASDTSAPRLLISYDAPATRYYGYFNPDYFYSYSSGVYYHAYKKVAYDSSAGQWDVETLAGAAATLTDSQIVSEKLWDGNWMNWLSMRRIDVLRKVLMGGKATARTGGGNQVIKGEIPAQTGRRYKKQFDSSVLSAVSPYDGNYSYQVSNGYVVVNSTSYRIWVQKEEAYDPQDFAADHNLAGVLQRVGDKARWGNIWFNTGTGSNRSGGTVEHVIGSNIITLITDLQNTGCDTWTPLAESFYVAMQYFEQEDPQGGLDYPNSAVPNTNTGDDPYLNSGQEVPCAKSFVILLTDGASTMDARIPSTYKDYDGDGDKTGCNESTGSNCDYDSSGTDFLDDLALYARTTDLRSATVGKSELEGDQNIILYTIYAFGNDDNARSLLKDAARNGGFEDKDGDNLPDGDYSDPPEQRLEWDADGDDLPDTFFEASDGYALEAKLLAAITDILRRASSGTAASVLSTNSEGEGNSVQAYYRPVVVNGLEEANWFGYLQNLWLDSYGNLREDSTGALSDGTRVLDTVNSSNTSVAGPGVDKIVQLVMDNNVIKVKRYTKHYRYNPANGNAETCTLSGSDCVLEYELEDISTLKPLFEAGDRLSKRKPNDRKIFTYVDKNRNSQVDGTEVIDFETTQAANLTPYLGVRDDATWGDAGQNLGTTQSDRVQNIITWIRGTDVSGLRNRTLDGVTWRLGDIVHSTPLTVAQPAERFDLIYRDKSYLPFYRNNKDRETVVYVGGNDGMLHAFTSWKYQSDATGSSFVKPAAAGTDEKIGDELWAYIPQAVLPHLKWTAMNNYTHTYYVDAKPRVFDAKIDNVWKTILVVGLNMGGKAISVNEDFGSGLEEVQFTPSYVCMDITDPRNPQLLWERSYTDLGMTTGQVSPLRVGPFVQSGTEKWYLAFGSGPTDYDGTSSQSSYIYVVDLKTGEPYKSSATKDWLFGPFDSNSFFNSPLAIDATANYTSDTIYLANNYYSANKWQAKVYRVGVKCSPCEWDTGFDPLTDEAAYDQDPANWVVSEIFDSPSPITAKMTAAIGTKDNDDHIWVYFGTGRYISMDDKVTTDQQYVIGLQDPFYNKDSADYHNLSSAITPLTLSDLFESNAYTVNADESVLHNSSTFTSAPSFSDLIAYVRDNYDGWYYTLDNSGGPSERIISRGTVFGRFLWLPSYLPSEEICGYGGNTQFYAFYYETGTNAPRQVFSDPGIKLPDLIVGPPPPAIGVHMGREGGGRILLQQGTGVVMQLDVRNFGRIKSEIADWWDDIN